MPRSKAQQLAAAKARYDRLRAEAERIRKGDDTHRKVVYGSALLLALDEMSPDLKAEVLEHVHRHITRPATRARFGIPPLTNGEVADPTSEGPAGALQPEPRQVQAERRSDSPGTARAEPPRPTEPATVVTGRHSRTDAGQADLPFE
ncbi:hypothetical protein [Rubellimicrobium roseum]|uniref:Mobilization protein n=1 Tax=Rubellimicrobium roseum TaxID=687525 RepID=A0A5C4N7K6_9RHOB|nr:hypothetical protein [Rubellimicrobium roseum]TNC68781.1 hypothetical protein FHG71_14240 [Rubellimicrobium roseum]